MKITSFILFCFFAFGANAQSLIQKMYKQKRYTEIVAMAPDIKKYGGQDIFTIGQSFLKLKENARAVEMFDAAIAKGYKNEEVYYAKGIAETNLKLYGNAQNSFRQALYFSPNRKKILIELAACYYKANELDSALVVYQKIESNWADYMPAIIMACQITHELKQYKNALNCYYQHLKYLKRDDFYYRQALEAIVRLEWHTFHRYDKTEVALKNLLETFPADLEYNMQLMQLYNYTGRYAYARLQEDLLMNAYNNLKLKETYYKKGAMLMEQFDSAQYQIEVYRNFQPELNSNKLYKAYIFNYDGSRPLGKIEATVYSDTLSVLTGYALNPPIEEKNPLTYEVFKHQLLIGLFLPETTDNDTITEY